MASSFIQIIVSLLISTNCATSQDQFRKITAEVEILDPHHSIQQNVYITLITPSDIDIDSNYSQKAFIKLPITHLYNELFQNNEAYELKQVDEAKYASTEHESTDIVSELNTHSRWRLKPHNLDDYDIYDYHGDIDSFEFRWDYAAAILQDHSQGIVIFWIDRYAVKTVLQMKQIIKEMVNQQLKSVTLNGMYIAMEDDIKELKDDVRLPGDEMWFIVHRSKADQGQRVDTHVSGLVILFGFGGLVTTIVIVICGRNCGNEDVIECVTDMDAV